MKKFRKYPILAETLNILDEPESVQIETAKSSEDLRMLRRLLNSPYSKVKFRLFDNPNITPEILNGLLQDDNTEVQAYIASQTNDLELLARLARHPEPQVRAFAARNYNITSELLERLVRDPDPRVRYEVLHSSKLNNDLLQILMRDPNGKIKQDALFKCRSTSFSKPEKRAKGLFRRRK